MKINRFVLLILVLTFFLIACKPTEEIWTAKDKNPIVVMCGDDCLRIKYHGAEIVLTPAQRAAIRHFARAGKQPRVFVSSCDTNLGQPTLNAQRIRDIKTYIAHIGYIPVQVKPTLPSNRYETSCINLVRGKLYLYVQRCPNMTVEPSVQCIGTNFGCATNYNLAQMIANPWDLLDPAGDSGTEGDRVAIGSKDYRTGKVSKLDMESSS